MSFCLLDLRNITVAPLPTVAGLSSISCAPRYAVLDNRHGESKLAVYVTERQTNSAFGAWFTTLGFSAPHPHVDVAITSQAEGTHLQVSTSERGVLFAATVHPSATLQSELFASNRAFADFIAQGITSYGLSRHTEQLTVMDLHKEDADYEPLEVSNLCGSFVEEWQADGAVLDSAFRTGGGRYEWTYHGLTKV